MLILKRMVEPYQVKKCKISGELIIWGDWYYEDNDDGVIIKAEVYKKLKEKNEKETFDYTLLERAKSEKEYREMLKKAEQQQLRDTILNRKIAKAGEVLDSGI